MTRVHGSAEQHKVARAVQCSVHERSTSMRLTPWQSWHGIVNHSTSPHWRQAGRATPGGNLPSLYATASCRLLGLLVILACMSWIGPRHVSAAPSSGGAASAHEVI